MSREGARLCEEEEEEEEGKEEGGEEGDPEEHNWTRTIGTSGLTCREATRADKN